MIHRFCEACNGCSFCFLACLTKHLLVEIVFASYYLKLSLLMFLECFLIPAKFQPHVFCRHVYYKKRYTGLTGRGYVVAILIFLF